MRNKVVENLILDKKALHECFKASRIPLLEQKTGEPKKKGLGSAQLDSADKPQIVSNCFQTNLSDGTLISYTILLFIKN
jgi:hypothetical protein